MGMHTYVYMQKWYKQPQILWACHKIRKTFIFGWNEQCNELKETAILTKRYVSTNGWGFKAFEAMMNNHTYKDE